MGWICTSLSGVRFVPPCDSWLVNEEEEEGASFPCLFPSLFSFSIFYFLFLFLSFLFEPMTWQRKHCKDIEITERRQRLDKKKGEDRSQGSIDFCLVIRRWRITIYRNYSSNVREQYEGMLCCEHYLLNPKKYASLDKRPEHLHNSSMLWYLCSAPNTIFKLPCLF